MAEYIDRGQLIADLKRFAPGGYSEKAALIIGKQPAVDVAPARHGRWVLRHKRVGGFRRYTGSDEMGEQHTIIVDERAEYDDLYCSECGGQSADNWLNYCPRCGARMAGEDGTYSGGVGNPGKKGAK